MTGGLGLLSRYYYHVMVRPMLTPQERARGQRLGAVLREAREAAGGRSMVEVAAAAGIPAETLRKIEAGRIPTPAFFTVVALAGALDIPLDALAEAAGASAQTELAGAAGAAAQSELTA